MGDFHEILAEITFRLDSIKTSESDSSSVNNSENLRTVNSISCKLPKLELPVFKGDPLEWQTFWDQFHISINQNEHLSDVDRFNYLKRYLSGEAYNTISGLTLTSENYQEAVDILKERYGNTPSSHYCAQGFIA